MYYAIIESKITDSAVLENLRKLAWGSDSKMLLLDGPDAPATQQTLLKVDSDKLSATEKALVSTKRAVYGIGGFAHTNESAVGLRRAIAQETLKVRGVLKVGTPRPVSGRYSFWVGAWRVDLTPKKPAATPAAEPQAAQQ